MEPNLPLARLRFGVIGQQHGCYTLWKVMFASFDRKQRRFWSTVYRAGLGLRTGALRIMILAVDGEFSLQPYAVCNLGSFTCGIYRCFTVWMSLAMYTDHTTGRLLVSPEPQTPDQHHSSRESLLPASIK